MSAHRCYGGIVSGRGNAWATCILCDGRIHGSDCTARVNPAKDCCPARHERMGIPTDSAQVRTTKDQTP
jgi:hypothetical protein